MSPPYSFLSITLKRLKILQWNFLTFPKMLLTCLRKRITFIGLLPDCLDTAWNWLVRPNLHFLAFTTVVSPNFAKIKQKLSNYHWFANSRQKNYFFALLPELDLTTAWIFCSQLLSHFLHFWADFSCTEPCLPEDSYITSNMPFWPDCLKEAWLLPE